MGGGGDTDGSWNYAVPGNLGVHAHGQAARVFRLDTNRSARADCAVGRGSAAEPPPAEGLWGIEAEVFIADLAPLGLDARTERSLREAIESYRRGVFLAASSLLGAAVEGAWYAAGRRLRSTVPAVGQLADGDRTAQLQGAITDALRMPLFVVVPGIYAEWD
jgi:hypothetical protein